MRHCLTTKLLRIRHGLPTVWRCAVVVFCLVGANKASLGETTRKQLLERPPLAECEVQLKQPPAEPEMAQPNVVNVGQLNPVEDVLDFYARGHDGQWVIPAEVDREDPWIRILIMGPSAPVVVDLAVYVNGVAFRDLREQWVDALVEQATAEPSTDQKDKEENGDPKISAEEVSESSAQDSSVQDTEGKSTPASVKVRSRQAPTAVERLRHYLAAGVSATDREEIRWLVAEWQGGPGLMTLGPAVSWRRAEVAPLWSWLDADHDRVLSDAEIKAAEARLKQADKDEDDIVEIDELQQSEQEHSLYSRTMSHPLAVILNEQTPWSVLRSEIVNLYGKQASEKVENSSLKSRLSRGDRSLSLADLSGLLQEVPDLVARVDLGGDEGKVALLASSSVGQDGEQAVSSSEQVITVDCGGAYIELSALTTPTGNGQEKNQFAIGAVVDGYPLFRLLDRDNNRRLSLRECRQLGNTLEGLDLDADGRIADAEIPTAIRLIVTRGLLAHEALKLANAASREISSQDKTAIPPWFADMDRNADGDLSRREFLGTSEQFVLLDLDEDGLINKKEAQDSTTADE